MTAALPPNATTKPAKPAKPATKRARTTKRKPVAPSYGEIAERAYFIHLDEGGEDQIANWFRAERELTAA